MTDEDFARAEMAFKEAINTYIDACNNYGVSVQDRMDDCLFDALKEAGLIE